MLNATHAVDIASLSADYFNVYYEPTIVMTPNQNKSSIIYSYMELVVNGAALPVDTSFSDMKNRLVDTAGATFLIQALQ